MAKLKVSDKGKLKIGNQWNAITVLALSQSNPLKAVAEFVENSIDAKAREITIIRGKERGKYYLRIVDDGEGIPHDEQGLPNFKYVATHICDSIKRQLKQKGANGIQGEFGIGLLSFWTVGEELILKSRSKDGKLYQMSMRKDDPNYSVTRSDSLFADRGTELIIRPLLVGVRQFSGEKIQSYLASELRNRIVQSNAKIKIIDHVSRLELKVEPTPFSGRRLRLNALPKDTKIEVHLSTDESQLGLYRNGTRVLQKLSEIPELNRPPWNCVELSGMVEAPYLNLTPGTRTGIVHDEQLQRLLSELSVIEPELLAELEAQARALDEVANRNALQSIQKAFKEALSRLPEEEYDWFDLKGKKTSGVGTSTENTYGIHTDESDGKTLTHEEVPPQKSFFEVAGPLFSVTISPTTCTVPVNSERRFIAVARDKSKRRIDSGIRYTWEILEGEGTLSNSGNEVATFVSHSEPTLIHIRISATQGDIVCLGEALVTVTDSLIPKKTSDSAETGLPGYTFRHSPGELWRSQYEADRNLIIINSGHKDFVYVNRSRAMKLRYICRLFAKEMILRNFKGYSSGHLLERMIELSMYTEENLR